MPTSSFGIELGFDWVALSFVQRPEDIAEARRLIGGRAAILAKIEKPAAIERLDEIIELADAVMVARGDLGVELPPELVPGLQKRIIRKCRDLGKPVVVATQMLESMISSPAPTRAEASDVATAVYDGADAVMLSAESASGDYPVEAVAIMDRIIASVEQDDLYRFYLDAYQAQAERTSADAITLAAEQVAHTLQSAVIVTYTTSGATALRASRERPDRPILGLITRMVTARKLALAWGVHPVHTADAHDLDEMVAKARQFARDEGFAGPGESIVITAGLPFGTPGRDQPAARRLGDLKGCDGPAGTTAATMCAAGRQLGAGIELASFLGNPARRERKRVCSRPRAGSARDWTHPREPRSEHRRPSGTMPASQLRDATHANVEPHSGPFLPADT